MVRDTLKEIEKCEDPLILVKSHIERAIEEPAANVLVNKNPEKLFVSSTEEAK